jgi:predicted MFS family arabinose efflux permease
MPDARPSLPLATTDRPRLTPGITLAMATAAGFAAANVWYNQPMLGVIAAGLHAPTHLIALVPTATQIGFAIGILFLLPLGDRMDRRTLILRQLIWLTVALLAAAAAPGPATLIAASSAIGAGASIGQQIIPFAAELAPPERRGRVVGMVMSGLLSGILLGRVLSGAVAEHFGWRAMFLLAAGLAVLMGGLMAWTLPRSRPSAGGSYGRLLFSLVDLIRAHRGLRRATLIQGGLFGGFSAFWSFLALELAAPPLSLGSGVAGLFGVLGAAGVAVATLAGRLSDRHGPRGVIGAGIALTATGFVVLAAWPTLAGIIAGLMLVDVGVQAAQVANQSVIYALQPDARGRLNTVFMTGMFIGGALGSGAAGIGWAKAGWTAVCAVGFALAMLALAVHTIAAVRPARHGRS